MPDWHDVLARLATEVEDYIDRARLSLDEVLDRDERPIRIAAYRGFGTGERALVRGRVLRDKGIAPATADDPWWRNLRAAYLRLESDEVPGARIRVRVGEADVEAKADEEGHFRIWVRPESTERGWRTATIRLLEPDPGRPVETRAPVLVPGDKARFGVISDLDDTVLRTEATSLLAALRNTLLGNAHTRMPFPGVAALYRALAAADTEANPLFYVSSSPWNLYDPLTRFLELNGIPPGPLALRDWGINREELLPVGHGSHKRREIGVILETYPHLPFILIGDSGQEDPEIYRDIVHDHPDRILAVYIRNLKLDPLREEAIHALAEEVQEARSSLVLADDTVAAAEHAAEHGWIPEGALDGIRARRDVDEKAPDHEDGPAPTRIEGR